MRKGGPQLGRRISANPDDSSAQWISLIIDPDQHGTPDRKGFGQQDLESAGTNVSGIADKQSRMGSLEAQNGAFNGEVASKAQVASQHCFCIRRHLVLLLITVTSYRTARQPSCQDRLPQLAKF